MPGVRLYGYVVVEKGLVYMAFTFMSPLAWYWSCQSPIFRVTAAAVPCHAAVVAVAVST